MRLLREDRRYFYLIAPQTGAYGQSGYVSAETNKRKGVFAFALIVGAEMYTQYGMRNAIYGSNLSKEQLGKTVVYGLSSENIYTSVLRERGRRVTEEEARAAFPDLKLF